MILYLNRKNKIMNGIEKVYYALGELAYLVAEADGKVQQAEVEELHSIVIDQIKEYNSSFEYSDIIFNVLKDEKPNLDLIYSLAFKELKEARFYMDHNVKDMMLDVLNKVAESYESISGDEKILIDRVEQDLDSLIQEK